MKRLRNLTLLLGLALGVMACQVIQQTRSRPEEPVRAVTAVIEEEPAEETPQEEPAEAAETPTPAKNSPISPPASTGKDSPASTPAPAGGKEGPTGDNPSDRGDTPLIAGEKPPQSIAADIIPSEMRTQLMHLTHWLGYQVWDANGDRLGIASDFIINTCETYIVYILMEPEASLKAAPGGRVVIPFEAVTINSGTLDAQNKAIQLSLIPEHFAGAPTLPIGQELTPTGWEGAVRSFWSEIVRIGKLSTGCNVPGGPIYKVAYASQLLGVELYDGLGNLLGTVQEAILEPESGKIGFYIVQPAKGEGLVMVHLRATNIPKEALAPGGTLTLVLLTDPGVFWDAPRLNSLEEADDFALQGKMREYWNR